MHIIAALVFSSSAAAAPISKSSSLNLLAHNTSQPNDPALISINIFDRKTSQPNDPNLTPVDILDLANDATMTCADTTFTHTDIFDTVKWGTLLLEKGVYRGKKSGKYPLGRYPHAYDDEIFTSNGHCPADNNRQEYPLLAGDVYNGGISNNIQWGKHRVVFYVKRDDDAAPGGNPVVYFCGGLTHVGAASDGEFLQCTVN